MTLSRRAVLVFAVAFAIASIAQANHSWGNYHWGRTANPFTLKTGDNVDSKWDAYLDQANSDWSQSNVLDLAKVAGQANPRNCRPTSGRIEVCNSTYGNNGWLGIASIWASGSHITQATTKVNDSYFNTSTYNTPAWRRLVMCQEIAHDFGLDHQDETFDNANLGSCMDYTNDPDGGAGGASSNDPSNEHPNSHDFQQISTIYSHTDSTNTYSLQTGLNQAASSLLTPVVIDGDDMNQPWQWGTPVRWDDLGRANVFVLRPQGSASDDVVITHVFWLPGHPRSEVGHDE